MKSFQQFSKTSSDVFNPIPVRTGSLSHAPIKTTCLYDSHVFMLLLSTYRHVFVTNSAFQKKLRLDASSIFSFKLMRDPIPFVLYMVTF